jgi:hypothetical protein
MYSTSEDLIVLGFCREGDRDVVYKEIKHLTILLDVKQVVHIYEVYETEKEVFIVMEVRTPDISSVLFLAKCFCL